MIKTLVFINEDFDKMVLGQNSTLAYIFAAVDLGHDVHVHKVSPTGFFAEKIIDTIHLNNSFAQDLVKRYKELNALILKDRRKFLVKDFQDEFTKSRIEITDVDYIIQRLEPMKPPFPPFGKININEYLKKLQDIFPDKKFNNPSECYGDKELPLVLNKDCSNIATPTIFYELFDGDCYEPQNFSKIFQTNKIVIKPENSAQGFGVFAIEFCDEGYDLETIYKQSLIPYQSFKIKDKIDKNEFRKIIEILCFVQFLKTQNNNKIQIKNFTKQIIENSVKSFYRNKVLVQPFLEGVLLGDIRINLAKNKNNDFVLVGSVFRKNINENNDDFTTGITSGHAIAASIEEVITVEEKENLITKINFVLDKLNKDSKLRKKYKNCLELGCDFILKGNRKEVFLGEVNHHCPALIPFAEFLQWQSNDLIFDRKIKATIIDYDGGLGMIKQIIRDNI